MDFTIPLAIALFFATVILMRGDIKDGMKTAWGKALTLWTPRVKANLTYLGAALIAVSGGAGLQYTQTASSEIAHRYGNYAPPDYNALVKEGMSKITTNSYHSTTSDEVKTLAEAMGKISASVAQAHEKTIDKLKELPEGTHNGEWGEYRARMNGLWGASLAMVLSAILFAARTAIREIADATRS